MSKDRVPAWLIGSRPWWVLAIAAVVLVLGGIFGSQIGGKLSNGGYFDSAAESSVANRLLMERFSVGPPQLVFLARAKRMVSAPDIAAAGRSLVTEIKASNDVAFAESYWGTKDPRLLSEDERATLILIGLRGNDRDVAHGTERLVSEFGGEHGPLRLTATGQAQVQLDLEARSRHDLVVAELVAAPLVGLALLVIFGSMFAAAMPLLVGLVSITVTVGFLRLLAGVTEVSIFALNVTTALGFALSLSYSLFLVTRFRAELAAGRTVLDSAAMATRVTGRTIVYSALTIAVCMSALLLLPTYFFRSLGLAGIGVVLLSAAAAVILMPAVLVLAGARLNSHELRRSEVSERRWKQLAYWVMRRPVPVIITTVLVLIVLALPFTTVRFGHIDEHWLPADMSSRMATETIRSDFPDAGQAVHLIVLPDQPTGTDELARYAADLSSLPGVDRVDSYSGIFRHGERILKQPPPGWFRTGVGTWLQIITTDPGGSRQAQDLVRRIRALDAPSAMLMGGDTAELVDLKNTLAGRLGWVLLLVSVATFVLLFLFTGSVVLPVKALLMNFLVAAAGLGIMVWIFQDGHLIGLVGGERALGAVDPMLPMFMTFVGFGVQLDYEIFLLSGIREEFLRSGNNTHAVAAGLARNGRLITSAACTLVISVGVLAISEIIVIKLIGVVLAAGLIIDATLIRILLVPSFMRLLGRWNWWAPHWLEASRDAVSRFRDRDRWCRMPVARRDHQPRAVMVGPGVRSRHGDGDATGSLRPDDVC